MPARSRRPQVTQLTGTTLAFDTPATPGSQNTHLMILTQAQSQELEGTDNSTQHGTQPTTSPHDEAGGLSAPAALFVFEGGAAKQRRTKHKEVGKEEPMTPHKAEQAPDPHNGTR